MEKCASRNGSEMTGLLEYRLDRTAIVGTSCSGKTTLARALSQVLGASHTELDALYWGPSWTPRPPDEFRRRVHAAVAEPRWVIDGNYSAVRDLVWGRASALIWLNYPLTLVFPRAVWRTLRRIVTQEPLFAGNREAFTITDPDWIPWWVLRTYRRRRREIPLQLAQPQYAHLQVLEFTQPAQAEQLLQALAARDSAETDLVEPG
jgi:adenylate kinase family enzyme